MSLPLERVRIVRQKIGERVDVAVGRPPLVSQKMAHHWLC